MRELELLLGLLVLSCLPMVWVGLRARFRHRGTRVVTCPETGLPAAVRVDGARAAASAAVGEIRLSLASCSCWPDRWDCGQQCLSQIEAAPAESLVRTMLVDWEGGDPCGLCGRAISEIHWVEHEPALLTPGRETVEWQDPAPENLASETYRRVCWRCHASSAWRQRFPGFRPEGASTATS